MSIEAYTILGIEPETLKRKDPEQIDKIVRDAYKSKLNELILKINEILSNDKDTSKKSNSDEHSEKSNKDLSEKLKAMEKIIQEYLVLKTAFSKIKSIYDREINSIEGVQGILNALDVEIEKAKKLKYSEERKKHLDKVEGKSGCSDGVKFVNNPQTEIVESTAYQVLKLPNNYVLSDLKVHTKVLVLLGQTVSKGALSSIEENEKMMSKISKLMWAYSKIGTLEARKRYSEELRFVSELKKELDRAKALIPALGKIHDDNCEQHDSIDITDYGMQHSLRITEEKDLSVAEALDKGKIHPEYAITEYSIQRFINNTPVKKSILIYSNIDIKKMRNDPSYQQAVTKLLISNKIRLARKFMAGYIGELVYVNGEWKVLYDDKNIAICEKYSKDKEPEQFQDVDKENTATLHTNEAPEDNDEPGGH